MSIFEDYIDELWGELSEMTWQEVREAQKEHEADPQAGFAEYFERVADFSHLPEQQQENAVDKEWGKFSARAVGQVYEDRLAEFEQLKNELEETLPIKGTDGPLMKV